MEQIVIKKILKENNRITCEFSVSEGLKHFFSCESFWSEYSQSVEEIPDSIAVIPFLGSVLPILWVTHGQLVLKELDEDFYYCLPEVLKGYKSMLPETEFISRIRFEELIFNSISQENRCAVMFSAGLDAANTLVNHYQEQPELLTIWGADIPCDDTKNWNQLDNLLQYYGKTFSLCRSTIRSNFRKFDREEELDAVYHSQLKDGWWHSMKHGIALLSLAAPCCYLHKISKLYIASSYTKADEPVRCASAPVTDNHVRFAGTSVIHDGYEFNRQDKTCNVVNFAEKTQKNMPLHVCWESRTGSNCCCCEKCYRTMVGLISEGANPEKFGFPDVQKTMPLIRSELVHAVNTGTSLKNSGWGPILNSVVSNQKALRKTSYWKYIRWLCNIDISCPETIQMPFSYRVRGWLGEFKWYQGLSRIKARLLHEEIK